MLDLANHVPVLEVILKAPGMDDQNGILKLYDPRFGYTRERSYSNTIRNPHSPKNEAAWIHYISSGLAMPKLMQLQYRDDLRKPSFVGKTDDHEENRQGRTSGKVAPKSELERLGEFECKVFYSTQKQFITELRAYQDLRGLQGRHLAKFAISVTWHGRSVPTGLPARYFQVPGIILEHIRGFPLQELVTRVPEKLEVWQEITQTAIDLTAEINSHGVFHNDCHPKNFLVVDLGTGKYQPYLLDFAKAQFRSDFRDTLDEKDRGGYLWNLQDGRDGCQIGYIMGAVIHRATKRHLVIRFPFRNCQTLVGANGQSGRDLED
ncbi:hypothetical protein BGZ63DRAFT_406300 [Mariannaea sp. PMI_226]|nr:hypothetical protein BGZ63DRAFT_406300 [Mariannaea sp. PMI_226]